MLKTTSVGLSMFVVGALLTAILLAKKPEDVTLADRAEPEDVATATRAISAPLRTAFGLFAVGVVLLVVSLATQ